MIARQYGFVLLTYLLNTILAIPAPAPEPDAATATLTAELATFTHIGPIRLPFPLDFTVLSYNYYEDSDCKIPLGSTNVSSFDLTANTCFALPGNSLIFTYQLHEGTLSLYNPNEVNSE